MSVYVDTCPDKHHKVNLCGCKPVCAYCGWGRHDHEVADHTFTAAPLPDASSMSEGTPVAPTAPMEGG